MSTDDFGLRDKLIHKTKGHSKEAKLQRPFFISLLGLFACLGATAGIVILVFASINFVDGDGSAIFWILVGVSTLSGASLTGAISEIGGYLHHMAKNT